jgi:hypothetical protein
MRSYTLMEYNKKTGKGSRLASQGVSSIERFFKNLVEWYPKPQIEL